MKPTDLDTAYAARNRRVEVFMANTPTAASRCRLRNKARLRTHLKIFHDPCISIPVMLENMKCLYGLAGFLVEVASIERLQNLPTLRTERSDLTWAIAARGRSRRNSSSCCATSIT